MSGPIEARLFALAVGCAAVGFATSLWAQTGPAAGPSRGAGDAGPHVRPDVEPPLRLAPTFREAVPLIERQTGPEFRQGSDCPYCRITPPEQPNSLQDNPGLDLPRYEDINKPTERPQPTEAVPVEIVQS